MHPILHIMVLISDRLSHKKILAQICVSLLFSIGSFAQTVNYSPAYFGPNANPVPEFTDATIPATTTVKVSGNYYFGFGDNTSNLNFNVEIPLLPERVSFKVWVVPIERYRVTQAIYDKRNMAGGRLSGTANGDFYVQTRMLILKERKIAPAIIFNSTLKTASGNNFLQRRYFDTPGYYFDVELGKSIHLENKIIDEIRFVANLGFFCWETTNSTQNDAFMYGGKIILSNRLFDFENSLSGYYGWMKNGDAPLVFNSKLIFKQPKFSIFMQYKYGIKDFPYHHVQTGISFTLPKLTPRY